MTEQADHLCVLVHGLWGNPAHLNALRDALRAKHAEDKIHILVTKRNSGSFTYDGIETGGERVADEIEEFLDERAQQGNEIKKISIIGYSLGGLISRYAIGLLYSKGLFEKIEPINFTTFATPHLGVRTPRRGYLSNAFNVLGARTLSASGRQLFLIDTFRDTKRPLLSILADTDSIFVRALARFRHRSLYANIVNDKTVAFYTAGISQTDPFEHLDQVTVNYLTDYDAVIVDAANPVTPDAAASLKSNTLSTRTRALFGRIPTIAFLMVLIPIGTTVLLTNAAIQSVRSRQRIHLHETGLAHVKGYRIPVLLTTARQEVEDMYETVNNQQGHDYLHASQEALASPTQLRRGFSFSAVSAGDAEAIMGESEKDIAAVEEQKPEFPTLALTPDQFRMIEHLDNVGFKKFPVHIQKHGHTHAAIIRRIDKPSFDEGRVVARHWVDHFEL